MFSVLYRVIFSAFAANSVFASGWEETDGTWKYRNDDGTFLSDGWNWIDGNTDGAWTVDNGVQTQNSSQAADTAQTADSTQSSGSTQTSFYGVRTADGYANQWANFRYASSSAFIRSGDEVLDYIDFGAYPDQNVHFPNLWFAFETADYDSEESWIQQTIDTSIAFGYTAERLNNTVLGDGNTYTLVKLTYGTLHEDYWMRSINGKFVYFRLIYTDDCADKAAAFLTGIKPY